MSENLLQKLAKLKVLSKSEKKICRYIEINYPQSLMQNITILSGNCNVSVASISRFVQRLGYKNYADFRKESFNAISDRLNSPISRYRKKSNDTANGIDYLQSCLDNMQKTIEKIDLNDFNNAVKILVQSNSLYVSGGATAQSLAKIFVLFAKYLRKNVNFLEPDISTIAHNISDMKKGDALLLFSQYRCSNISTKLAKFFSEKKCDVILVTDRQVNPISPYAKIILAVSTENDSLFNTRTTSMAVLEALIDGMLPYCKPDMEDRFTLMEEIFKLFDVYGSK